MKNHSNREYCELTHREFKIAVMKKLRLQENSERQFNELRNKINEQKEYFTKEVETLKKHQTEILELNNSINKVKNTTESIGNRADHMEKRISKFKDRNLEMIQVEEKRQLRS